MASVKVLTHEDWERRALELAESKHLTGTAVLLHTCEHGEVFRVPSGDRTSSYNVLLRRNGLIDCPCKAGLYGHRACGHAGAVISYDRNREEASRSDEAWSWWMHGGEWDE